MTKVAIIGGGPAGLTAAIEGAKKGFQVDLFERYKVGDDIRCAEGFFDTLNLLGEPKYGVRFKVDQLELEIEHLYTFPLDEKVNIWMIDRSEWQRGLAEEAKSLGVNVIENSPISKEKYEELRKHYDWVIDSTGAPSVTSRVYGFSTFYKENAGITAQYTLHGDFSSWLGRLKAALEEHYNGYYWIFPKSEQEANVGIIFFTENDLNPWQELERILEKECFRLSTNPNSNEAFELGFVFFCSS
ncbi:NAD(P)/FAD-dependent oxidoreductase, partial [Ureibacillus thermophilus]|uniref:NAD(P)/FAD-dependent oxidoreductase n=1 Tax=Ureibacillus thermophilus TaxID=367743 RepID=UPI00360A3877